MGLVMLVVLFSLCVGLFGGLGAILFFTLFAAVLSYLITGHFGKKSFHAPWWILATVLSLLALGVMVGFQVIGVECRAGIYTVAGAYVVLTIVYFVRSFVNSVRQQRIQAIQRRTAGEYQTMGEPSDRGCNAEAPTVPDDEVDLNESLAEAACSRVRNNLYIDFTVFNRYGAVFKCNPVAGYSAMQLNFEIFNTQEMAQNMEKDAYFLIVASLYDMGGNLLLTDQNWIEGKRLRTGYVADDLFFYDDSVFQAYSAKVRAVDPATEEEDDW